MLEAKNISHKYGNVTALDNLSLSVGKKEIVALLGPDGAGKTTLMRILCNLINPTSASAMTMAGHDITHRFRDAKHLLGYMPQRFSLYPDLSVEENMSFYAGIYGLTGSAYTHARDRMYAFSNLGEFAHRRAAALSGGMKQKLALSCALLHQPEILILDEPTTGVDPLSRRQFWKILLKLRDDSVSILVATPYMDEVARADRVICMYAGRKLSEAEPAQLAAQFEGNVFRVDMTPSTKLLSNLNSIPNLKARRYGAGLHLSSEANRDSNSIAATLADLSIDSSRIEQIKPSIEDRFIQLMEHPN
ncbi:MAG: ABC transporter ATP-binding protein [candidate division Zixibacteria bacterium]